MIFKYNSFSKELGILRCTKCKKYKDVSEYTKRGEDKYWPECKQCGRERKQKAQGHF